MKSPAFILFGGFGALRYPEFYRSLRMLDLHVLVIDRAPTRITAQNLAQRQGITEHLAIEPEQLGAILQEVENWSARYEIRGLFNTSEDFVIPAAFAADRLDVDFPGLRAALISRDKSLQRAYFPEFAPAHLCFEAGALRESFETFPAVLKPLTSHGGAGIQRVDSITDALDCQHEYVMGEPLLLEEFMIGIDVNVETLVWRGEVIMENITEEVEAPAGLHFLEMGYTIPAATLDQATVDEIYRTNRTILSRTRFRTGVMHAEYKITDDGVRLIEFAARTPGDGVLPLYQLSTGQPMEDQIIKGALGQRPIYPRPRRPVRQVWFEHPPCTLEDVSVDGFTAPVIYYPEVCSRNTLDPSDRAGLREVLVEWPRGARTPALREAADRFGSFLIDADKHAELDELHRKVLAAITITAK